MRLIDADALKYKQQVMYKKDGSDDVWAEWFTTATEINNAPTIDAVPVVRCGDCLFCQMELGEGSDEPWCDIHGTMVDTEMFCSWGIRKDNG